MGEAFVAIVGFALLLPVVMAVRRIRLGACSPAGSPTAVRALQAANTWLFLALLAAAGLPGTFYVWRIYPPGAQTFIVGAFWVGLAAAAVLVAFPRRRISATTNLWPCSARPSSPSSSSEPCAAPRIRSRSASRPRQEWQVVSGGGSALVNSHRTLDGSATPSTS